MTREQQHAADRDAFLSGVDEDAEAPAEKPAPVKKPARAVESVDDEAAETDDEDDDLDEDLDDLDTAVDEEEDAETDKEDPAVTKAHAKIRKLETRMREGLAREKAAQTAEINGIVEKMRPKIEAAEKFDRIPKHDVVAILKAKGYTEEDLEDVSRMIFGHSKAAAADPRHKEASARIQRERELRDELADTKARQSALEERIAKSDESVAQQRALDDYMGRVSKSAKAESTPILKEMLSIAPKKTARALESIATRVSARHGQAD